MQHVKVFAAGYIATLLFHQGMLYMLHMANPEVPAPFNMAPVPPLGVPAVISLAFWGGLWGNLLWLLMQNSSGSGYWTRAILIGAIGPSAVALFVVMPLKGLGVAMGWNPQIIVGALILNAAWGLGVGIIMKLLPGSSGKSSE